MAKGIRYTDEFKQEAIISKVWGKPLLGYAYATEGEKQSLFNYDYNVSRQCGAQPEIQKLAVASSK